ncbi:MAG: hypothetical protein MJZ22_01340 [Candidatus Saccharibacteria bacterium]|nr:hypothetical protein [Candidatus Saccharibacteria bacterium]
MKKFRSVFLAFLASLVTLTPVFALDSATLDFYARNNIYWFDPEGSLYGCNPDKNPQGSNITWIGSGAFSDEEIAEKFPGITLGEIKFGDNGYIYNTSRDFDDGISLVDTLAAEGELKNLLIFEVDLSGDVEEQVNSLLATAGNAHNIVLVSRSGDNTELVEVAKNYSNIAVADLAASSDPMGSIYAAASTLSAASASAAAENVNYAGEQVWSDAEMEMIQANRPFYEKSAEKYNMPWQILAVLHSIEHGLSRTNPANGQGIYQLYSYTAGGTNSNRFEPTSEPVSDEEFQRQTDLAAEFVLSYGFDLNSDNGAKQLFFRYNGMSEKYVQKAIAMGFSEEEARSGDGSAYVMNRYDARRDPTSSQMDPLWKGRFVGDGVYDSSSTTTVFGAFVKYAALGGASGGFCASDSSDIAEVALTLSWPGLRSHPKDDPKPEYITAMKDVGNYITPCNGSGSCAPIGASCDIFVSTVMMFSGADPEFPQYGPSRQRDYMLEHPDMYAEIDHGGDIGTLQPGDILVTDGHIMLYVEIDGVPGQASASFNDRTGEHFESIYFEDTVSSGHRYYRAFRRINR